MSRVIDLKKRIIERENRLLVETLQGISFGELKPLALKSVGKKRWRIDAIVDMKNQLPPYTMVIFDYQKDIYEILHYDSMIEFLNDNRRNVKWEIKISSYTISIMDVDMPILTYIPQVGFYALDLKTNKLMIFDIDEAYDHCINHNGYYFSMEELRDKFE